MQKVKKILVVLGLVLVVYLSFRLVAGAKAMGRTIKNTVTQVWEQVDNIIDK